MKRKKTGLILLLSVCLLFSGCRTRTTGIGREERENATETADTVRPSQPGSVPDEENGGEEKEMDGETGERTQENPEASRKEYDENAPAEIVPGTERTVHGPGEGGGAFADGEETDAAVAKLNENAEETASQTVAADQAEQMGVSEDGEEADSAMTYYTVLLQDRMGSLFECQRQNVYWETAEDRVTVFKTSLEHDLILNAGAYDVSARLLQENLRVDDGWIGRKNPNVIVKTVERGVLGTGVFSTDAARKIRAGLLARDGFGSVDAVKNGRVLLLSEELLEAPHLQTAAMLLIAKTANPDVLSDVDMEKALNMLAEEATGSIPAGIYYLMGREE